MKQNKWLSLWIAMAMLLSACCFILPVSAEDTAASVSYVRDFTGAESLSAFSDITVSGAGEANLVTEADGNVALRASGVKNLKLTSGATTSNKVEVSYKFKVIQSAATGYGDQVFFGTVRNNTTHAIRAIHYKANLNFYTGGSNASKFDMVSATGDGVYHTVKYIIDFESGVYKLYLDGVYTKDWGGNDWKFYTSGVTAVDNIYFMTKATDEVYLDDIIVKDIVPPTSWNFEDSTTVSDYSGLTVSGTTSIVDGALKAEANSSVAFTFPKTEADRVQVKFKLKSDAALTESGYEQGDFGAMYNDSSLVIRSTLSNGKGMTQYPITGANQDNPGGRRQKITTAGPDAFQEIVYDIDFKNQTYIPTVDGALIEHWGYRHFEIVGGNTTVNTLKFTPRSNVIYLDDVEIIQLPAEGTEWNFESAFQFPIDGLFAGGNAVSVVTEDDGNHAMYVSAPTTIRFRSPDTTASQVMVSYRIKVATAATNLSNTSHQQFAAVKNDSSTAVHTAHYQKYGILAWIGTGNSNRTMFKFNDAAGDGTYHSIKYLLNFDTHTYSVYVDGTLHSELTNAAFRDSSVNSINNLYFFVNPGDTFYLDDVKIKEVPPVGSWNFEESETFTDYQGITASGSAEIVKDGTSGNVLKLTGASTLQFDVPATVSNRVEVRYKMRGELANQSGLYSFGSVRTGSTETVRIIKYQGGITNFNGEGNNNYLTLEDLAEWKDVLLVLDMDNQTYRTYVDGVLKPYHANAKNYDKKFYRNNNSINNIYFNLIAGNTLYIDDVSVKDVTLNAVKTTITDVDPKAGITATFDNAISYDSVNNKANFALYEGETPVSDFTVTREDDNILTFSTPFGLSYGKTYTLKVLSTINTETKGFARTAEDIVITASTLTMPDVAPQVKETHPKDGSSTGIVTPVITFENPIAAGSVSVSVTDETGASVSGVTVSESGASCAYPKATLSIPGMTFGKTYTVTVNQATGAGTSGKPIAASKTFTFRTREIAAENAVVVANGTDGTIRVSAYLLNNTDSALPYTYLAALYKGSSMVAADSVPGTLSASGKEQGVIHLPQPSDFGEDYNVKIFAWNSVNTATPYMQALSITETTPFDQNTYWTKDDLTAWKANYDARITDKNIDGFNIGVITDVQRDDTEGFKALYHHYGLLTESVNMIGDVDCVADLGDMIGGNNPSKPAMIEKLAKQTAIMQEAGVPVFRVIGNHDDNQGGVIASKSMDSFMYADDWTKASNADWENVMDSSTAGKKPYYYKDFEKDKIRVITLNSSDVTWDYTRQTGVYFAFGFRQQQLEWLAEEALDFSAKGDDKTNWGVVFMMHVGVSDGGGIYNYSGLTDIITAFQNGTSGIINKTNDRPEMNVLGLEYDFTAQGPMETICTLDGHTHYDQSMTWNNMLKVTTTSSNRVNGNQSDVGIDIITIDRANHKVYATRLGKGADREWDY
ncbi:MAG: Ig-like domain-containing protein [Clostridia bacterium]|nr:Ig-like domain-containing protein [Clostridia bacterium]